MNEHAIVRSVLEWIARTGAGQKGLLRSLCEWGKGQGEWLHDVELAEDAPLEWGALLAGMARGEGRGAPRPQMLLLADELASLLGFSPFDARLLAVMIAAERMQRVCSLLRLLSSFSLPGLLGELAGADPDQAERLVRRSPVLRLGLVSLREGRSGALEVDLRWTLERLLDRAPENGEELIELLVGARQGAALSLGDFAHVDDAEFLVRVLRGALDNGARGVNLLIHGPPGTGKTELARTLAEQAGAALHGVGECDIDDDEPTRWERLSGLRLAQGVLGGRGRHVLLFDELEDLLGNARRAGSDGVSGREGSKVFLNRMLEENPVPVIWTSNRIDHLDHAIARRMSFILHLDRPSRAASVRILGRLAEAEGVAVDPALAALAEHEGETASVLRTALKTARLAGDQADGARVARSLVKAMNGQAAEASRGHLLDLGLFETDRPIGGLFDAMRASGLADISLLLSGPPGTGKTALAHHLARHLDRPLLVKRASDLISKWVGETEQQIAEAFAEARREGALLLFDEADSLLFDRANARARWEVGQVNEFLTWLDHHPLPVVAATNHPGQLDPAMMRRFDFKLALRPLGPDRAAQAFERFFARPAPEELRRLSGLTPGDFAVVARQLRLSPVVDAREIAARLAAECAHKPGERARIGF